VAHRRLRHLLEARLGAPGRALLAWRTRGRAEALLARRGLAAAAAEVATRLGDRVQRGPFAGMHYPRRRGDIVHVAKLLGAYECELHGAVERLLARAPSHVINIGSGDGYYAVGIARRLPDAAMIVVDPDPIAQRACAATAALNGVRAALQQLALMDATALEGAIPAPSRSAGAALARPSALCVVDCEGCEDELLDPARTQALARADLLVETHDFAHASVTARLAKRFEPTHDAQVITPRDRDPAAFAELALLSPEVASGLLDEFRHVPQSWLVLTVRSPVE
jgi:hypothetical protein